MKLPLKITGTLVLVVIVALGLASFLIQRTINNTYRAYLNDAQQDQLAWLAHQVELYRSAGEDWSAIQNWLITSGRIQPQTYAPDRASRPGQLGIPGRPPADQRNLAPRRQEAPPPAVRPDRGTILVVDQEGNPLGYAGEPVPEDIIANGIPIYEEESIVALLVSQQVGPRIGIAEAAVFAGVQRAILFSAILGALLAMLLGGMLVWTILRPLSHLRAAVGSIADGDMSARAPSTDSDEIGELSRAFNTMAARLEQQEHLRQRLLSDVAHELRTPLSIIQGNLQAMLDGVFPTTADEIRRVHREGMLLNRLVDDLHELAQAEAGVLSLELQPVDVAETMRQLQKTFLPIAQANALTINIDPPATNTRLRVDPDRLQQMLYNLVANAIRHTPPQGIITVAARPIDQEWVRVSVSDTGEGISAAHLPHVFDRFYRADASRRRDEDPTPGVGLGLSIVRALAEAHGGRVGATSTPGDGSTFWLKLPKSPQIEAM